MLALAGGSRGQAAAVIIGRPKVLAFENLHTGERLSAVFRADQGYLPDALRQIDRVLRDHRTDEVHPIDTRLLELLATLCRRLELRQPFQVISGYRSPRSNAMLAEASGGVARHSLHLQGMAIDIRVAGVPLQRLRDAALALDGGGVGYYPKSDFVHVDVGRVRRW